MDVKLKDICESENNFSMTMGYISIFALMCYEMFVIYFHEWRSKSPNS